MQRVLSEKPNAHLFYIKPRNLPYNLDNIIAMNTTTYFI